MNPLTGEVEETDVCARLDSAVERVYWHLADFHAMNVRVEVSHDNEEDLEGIAFFDENHEILGCVTVYQLERDTSVPEVDAITIACQSPAADLQKALNHLFRN